MNTINTSTVVNLKINHLGISVPDLESAVQWYVGNLGFCQLQGYVHFKREEAVERAKDKHIFHIYDEPFSEARVAYLLSGNGVGIELFQFINPPNQGHTVFGPQLYAKTGCYHIGLTHPDPKGFSESLIQAGAVLIGNPVDLAPGETIMYLRDPFGLIFELLAKDFDALVGLANQE